MNPANIKETKMSLNNRNIIQGSLPLMFLLLTACGGGGGGDTTTTTPPPPAATTYTVSGAVSGFSVSGLKLTNNSGDELTINAAGTFVFATPLANASTYNVQVSQNPSAPAQVCTVSGNTGTVSGANVSGVNVVCSVLTLSIQSTSNTSPGSTPNFTFQVKNNGVPVDIITTPLTSLRATISGPTTDYANYAQAAIQGSGATGTITPVDAANGVFNYTFPASAAIPVFATGSYAIALHGYVSDGTPTGVRFSAVAPVQFFAVTDAMTTARRVVVDDAKCNACHAKWTAHGGNYRGVQFCVFCHNPSLSNDTQVARLEGEIVVSPSMDMKVLIHKIHRGTALTQQPTFVWSSPGPSTVNPTGTPINYGLVTYPADPKACKACHLPDTYNIPLAQGLQPSTAREITCSEPVGNDVDSYCTTPFFTTTATLLTQPIAAACTSCHDAAYTAAHAATMTTAGGVESCPTCHAIGRTYGIEVNHTVAP